MDINRALRIGNRINNSTSGSILFVDSTNKIAEDNSNLFWDNTNNRVGIGTATPLDELHIFSAGHPTARIERTSTAGFSNLHFYEGANIKGSIVQIGSTYGTVARRNDLEIKSIDGDVTLQPTGGNVGIGTVTPAHNISSISPSANVNAGGYFEGYYGAFFKTLRVGNAICIQGNASDAGLLFRAGADANNNGYFTVYDTTGNADVHLDSSGDSYFNGGDVGIGTATPASKLEVNGAISSSTATITASSDITDVSGINTLFINITGDIVLGGLTGGVNGQTLNIIMLGNFVNHVTLEHAEGVSAQDFINHLSVDELISHGGCIYVCNGTNWYDASHARHV